MTDDILEHARRLEERCTAFMDSLSMQSPMKLREHHKYDLEIPENTHWELVKLAADLKMHHEDYAINVLIGHVESELDRKTKD